jgi:hypothetical protein
VRGVAAAAAFASSRPSPSRRRDAPSFHDVLWVQRHVRDGHAFTLYFKDAR